MSEVQLFKKPRTRIAAPATVAATATASILETEGGARRKRARDEKDDDDDDDKTMGGSFSSLGLGTWLQRAVAGMGLRFATPIQRACIPAALGGASVVVGSAPTGSGKTAAFALPVLEQLSREMYGIFAVVLTPTRELAMQIAEQFAAFGEPIKVRCEVIIGGLPELPQALALKRLPHVVVATPGRLAFHLRTADPPRLSRAMFLILDESDRLLDFREVSGFKEDLLTISSAMPSPEQKRQTFFFSATSMTATETLKIAAPLSLLSKKGEIMKFNKEMIFEWHATPGASTVATLSEEFIIVPEQAKHAYLTFVLRRFGPETNNELIETGIKTRRPPKVDEQKRKTLVDTVEDNTISETEKKRPRSMIIFTSTCKACQIVGEMLMILGLKCVILHAKLTQGRRLAALAKFRSGSENILVATDVASRGLDIPDVDLVLNYDVPRDPVNYVHRVGRTARAGRQGRSITFVTQFDVDLIHAIEKRTSKKLIPLREPFSDDEVTLLLGRATKALHEAKLKIAKEGNKNEKLGR